MDEVVEFELVDFACIELSDALADMVEQLAKLHPVVVRDELPRGLSLCLLRPARVAPAVFSHAGKVRQARPGPPMI